MQIVDIRAAASALVSHVYHVQRHMTSVRGRDFVLYKCIDNTSDVLGRIGRVISIKLR